METKREITAWVREELARNAEEAYGRFHRSLVPNIDSIHGVRTPKMREIARKTAREGYREFAQNADPGVYEELMIRGMTIGYAKLSFEEQKEELRTFVPLIDNWGVCDCCCATYPFMKKNQEMWFSFLAPYLSGGEFEVRFAVVCMLDYFINETFIDRVLARLSGVHHEGYYAKMAVAWAVSVCYVKFREKTEAFLLENTLDGETHNKAIQKIRESRRVAKEDKEKLAAWKRRERFDRGAGLREKF